MYTQHMQYPIEAVYNKYTIMVSNHIVWVILCLKEIV